MGFPRESIRLKSLRGCPPGLRAKCRRVHLAFHDLSGSQVRVQKRSPAVYHPGSLPVILLPQRSHLLYLSTDELFAEESNRTSGNDVVYNEYTLSLFDRIRLYLEEVLPVLFLIACGFRWSRQLALLPHRHKSTSKA